MYGAIFKAFYFIRDACENDTYIICGKINGCLPRKLFKKYMRLMAKLICGGSNVALTKFSLRGQMQGKVNSSGVMLMRKVAGYKKENMYVMLHDTEEQSLTPAPYMDKIDIISLVDRLKQEYQKLMITICLAPHGYDTILSQLQTMTPIELKSFFRYRDLESVYNEVSTQVYDVAVNSISKKTEVRQVLQDECVKVQVFTQVHEKVYGAFIMCILGREGYTLDHPSVYYSLKKNLHELFAAGLPDFAVYHPDFIVSILLVSRNFARVCMQTVDSVSSNNAVLLLCGAPGAGKSIVTTCLSKYCAGYKWNCDTIYQGPSILSSSVVVIEEVRLDLLNSPLYKQLLDFTSSVKIEIKNAHPVDGSKYCPVIMNTNENIFEFMARVRNGRPSLKSYLSDDQLEAVKRRLTILPFTEKFVVLHQLDSAGKSNVYRDQCKDFFNIEKNVPQIFNFIMMFSILQNQYTSFQVDVEFKRYFMLLISQFDLTIFGRSYIQNKGEIDGMLDILEDNINGHGADERQVERQFFRISNDIGNMINKNILDVIQQCPNRQELLGIWKNQGWTEASEFMRKYVIINDSIFKTRIFLQTSLTMVCKQWGDLIGTNELQLESDDDDKIESAEDSDIEKYFRGATDSPINS